jgi:tetratricopeptide (TPR) repeat protein
MPRGRSVAFNTMLAFRIVPVIVLVAALTGATMLRNVRWQTLLTMWEDCARKSPNKSRTHNNLGNCHMLLGKHFSAMREYQQAVALEPGNMEAQFNLARVYDMVGLYSQAMRPYDIFCRSAPKDLDEHRVTACRRLQELLAEARARAGSGGAQ